ncbi:MAG: phenylalanyl-tRNA synthetase subunit beta [Bacteroidetes bacterium OLB11]|nr:MAG: phenylalanyl-tRNA synthetase subunit beta [Bacteroidetes bacterium OLB11]
MISDTEKHLCIAGVFGGKDSGISEASTAVFLESAWFLPNSIRRTSMRHQLRTDAAIRFEKSVDISNALSALQRAIALIVEIAGGTVCSEILDVYPEPFQKHEIDLNYQKMNEIAGKEYTKEQVNNILKSLTFEFISNDENNLKVAVPFAKNDVRRQVDVLEEIMRIDGLDNIPFTGKMAYTLPSNKEPFQESMKARIAQQLTGKGFYEIFTNSITNAAYYENQDELVKMMNSLSSNLDTMRPSMLETGLESISYNFNRKNTEIKFFEFGKIYKILESKFEETNMLALYASGNQHPVYWNSQQTSIDLFYLKGIVENLFSSMNLQFTQEQNLLKIQFQKRTIGLIQKVDAQKLKQFDLKQDVIYAEIIWDEVNLFYKKHHTKYTEIPKYPIVQRDLAFIIDKSIQYTDIQKCIKQVQSSLLQNIQIFDVFESEKVGKNKKSYAIKLSFYDAAKTLTDQDVENEMNKIVQSLESKLGVNIRKS